MTKREIHRARSALETIYEAACRPRCELEIDAALDFGAVRCPKCNGYLVVRMDRNGPAFHCACPDRNGHTPHGSLTI